MLKRIADFVFGARLQMDLPERTRRTLSDQQIDSEILIGWAQLALVTFFAGVSPVVQSRSVIQPCRYSLRSPSI